MNFKTSRIIITPRIETHTFQDKLQNNKENPRTENVKHFFLFFILYKSNLSF